MSAPDTTVAARPRGVIPSLDGFRFLAVLVVFLGHAGLSPLIPGGFGVTVFFFLSGYLITTLLTREHDRYGRIAFGAFFARRAVRLLPPLLITLAAAAPLAWFGLVKGDLDPRTFASQILFYYNYYALYGDGGSSVAGFVLLWSLSVEEHFYLIWPALFLLFARGRLRIGHLLLVLLAILAWRSFRFLVWGDNEWVVYSLTDTRFDSLLYGCLLALLEWRGQARRLFPERTGPALALCGLGLAVIFVTFLWRDALFRSTLRYSLQGIALMPIFHYAVARAESPLARPLNWGWVRQLGVWSYVIYLSHFVLVDFGQQLGLADGSAGLLLLAGTLTVGWAALVYALVERPLKRLRARLTGHHRRGERGPAGPLPRPAPAMQPDPGRGG